jgi:PAS domain-containing protein
MLSAKRAVVIVSRLLTGPIETNNITEPKPAQEGLRTSEIRYRRLFEAARDGILILNAATLKITDVNPFMRESKTANVCSWLATKCTFQSRSRLPS